MLLCGGVDLFFLPWTSIEFNRKTHNLIDYSFLTIRRVQLLHRIKYQLVRGNFYCLMKGNNLKK